MTRPFRLCAAAAALACLLSAAPAIAQHAAGRLELTFETGAERGVVLVALFDAPEAYAGGRPVRQARIDVAAGERTTAFADLPPGDYAVRAFHDLDDDGAMDANPFGMPVEPYAFSNNARGNMGPASWERARFPVAGAVAQTIVIR